MKQTGITFVEILIVISIIALLIIIVFNPNQTQSNQVSFGVNGFSETRCINNYLFTVGNGGQARQILDELGRGIKCKN